MLMTSRALQPKASQSYQKNRQPGDQVPVSTLQSTRHAVRLKSQAEQARGILIVFCQILCFGRRNRRRKKVFSSTTSVNE